ncbi:MAG: DUF4912 domain-containing protein [Fibrobacter sp.]|nr:DUF4912 domain-containing protein [Fibrobacter sp.]
MTSLAKKEEAAKNAAETSSSGIAARVAKRKLMTSLAKKEEAAKISTLVARRKLAASLAKKGETLELRVTTAKPKKTTTAKSATQAATKTSTKATAKPSTKATAKKAPVKAASKVATRSIAKPVSKSAAKLDQSFDAEYLVLMQKDPNWLHAFWEVSESRMDQAKNGKGKFVLRLFDISGDLTVQRSKKRKFHDVEVPADARSWYVENPVGNSCMAVLGSVEGDRFMPILESSPVLTFDKNAVVPSLDDEFVRASLGGRVNGNFMSSGFSSTTAESWLNSLRLGSSSESMFSGALSSAALKSNEIAAPKDSVNYGKDFFLWVKTRLIVYGGTRPDAHLQVRGEPFPLNPDGTFSFEEDLPDSTKIIPVFATDKDGDFPTTIVPIVVKRTE